MEHAIDTTDLSYQIFEHAYHAGWKREYGVDTYKLFLETIHEIQAESEITTFYDIVQACSVVFNVSTESLQTYDTKKAKYNIPRSFIFWYAYFFTNLTTSEIGDRIAARDHATVLHHVCRINDYLTMNIADKNRVMNIYRLLMASNKRLLLTSRETQKKPNVPDGMYYTLYIKQQPKH